MNETLKPSLPKEPDKSSIVFPSGGGVRLCSWWVVECRTRESPKDWTDCDVEGRLCWTLP